MKSLSTTPWAFLSVRHHQQEQQEHYGSGPLKPSALGAVSLSTIVRGLGHGDPSLTKSVKDMVSNGCGTPRICGDSKKELIGAIETLIYSKEVLMIGFKNENDALGNLDMRKSQDLQASQEFQASL